MKQGWNILKLSDACTLTMGQSPISESYNTDGDGLPFFQGCSDFGKINPTIRTYCNAPTKIAEANDVLMSVRAPIGTLNIANVKCCIGRGLASFRATSRTTNSYLYYFLKHSRTKLESLGTGSTFKAIGKDALSKFPIPVPPIEEQKAICSLLDNLNLVIEKKKEQIAELDNLAQSLFYDMFGDPVVNDKGWVVKQFNQVGELQRGGGFLKSDFVENGVPCIHYGQIHMKFGRFIDRHLTEIPESVAAKSKIAKKGDVILAITSEDVEGSCKCTAWMGDYAVYVGAHAAIFKHNLDPIYVSYYIMSSGFQRDKERYVHGIKVMEIKPSDIGTINILVPPLPLQQAFAEKVKAIEQQKELINQSIKDVQTLFDAKMDFYFGD